QAPSILEERRADPRGDAVRGQQIMCPGLVEGGFGGDKPLAFAGLGATLLRWDVAGPATARTFPAELVHDRVSCLKCSETGIATGRARLPVRSAMTPRASPIGKFNATTAASARSRSPPSSGMAPPTWNSPNGRPCPTTAHAVGREARRVGSNKPRHI